MTRPTVRWGIFHKSQFIDLFEINTFRRGGSRPSPTMDGLNLKLLDKSEFDKKFIIVYSRRSGKVWCICPLDALRIRHRADT